jgi:hypothetical protein
LFSNEIDTETEMPKVLASAYSEQENLIDLLSSDKAQDILTSYTKAVLQAKNASD